MIVVHAADLHIDSPLRGFVRFEGAPVELVQSATRRAFENLIALCLEERASLLLLAGDIFDGAWQHMGTGIYFLRELARLRETNTRIAIIRGNHDAKSKVTRELSYSDHVIELSSKAPETRVFEDLGVAVHGQSYPRHDLLDNIARSYPAPVEGAFNVGLLHTALSGRKGHDPYAPCTLDDLLDRGYQYWALGHVHTREIVHADPHVVFPGNLQGRHIREPGDKGATLLEIEGTRVVRIEHQALDVVRFLECAVDVGAVEHRAAVLERVLERLTEAGEAADGRPLIARVRLEGQTSLSTALSRSSDELTNELRLALAEAGVDVYLTEARVRTEPLRRVERHQTSVDGIGHIEAALRAIAEDADAAGALAARLPRLPRPVQAAMIDASDEAERRAFAREVEAVILDALEPR